MQVIATGKDNVFVSLSIRELEMLLKVSIGDSHYHDEKLNKMEGKVYDLLKLEPLLATANNVIWQKKKILKQIQELRVVLERATFVVMTDTEQQRIKHDQK